LQPTSSKYEIFTVPVEYLQAVWPDVKDGMVEVSKSTEWELDIETVTQALMDKQMVLHIMTKDDEAVAFMVTQRLFTGTGIWLDMPMGYSIDKKPSTFFRFVKYLEQHAVDTGHKGLKFITTQDKLVDVMCRRMGYRQRFVEVLKEV
jgi:hypothetical protein